MTGGKLVDGGSRETSSFSSTSKQDFGVVGNYKKPFSYLEKVD
jgi:hypothetical protein